MEGVVGADGEHRMVRKKFRRRENKETVLRCLRCDDIPRESNESLTEFAARFAKDPPFLTIGESLILISVRLHTFIQPLDKRWMLSARILKR
jgi:hypothetical protein